MRSPSTAWRLTISYSSAVSRDGLSRISIGVSSLPMSCSSAASPRSRSWRADRWKRSPTRTAISAVRITWSRVLGILVLERGDEPVHGRAEAELERDQRIAGQHRREHVVSGLRHPLRDRHRDACAEHTGDAGDVQPPEGERVVVTGQRQQRRVGEQHERQRRAEIGRIDGRGRRSAVGAARSRARRRPAPRTRRS